MRWNAACPNNKEGQPSNSRVTEAILDVVSSHPGGLSKTYVDVTIRAPHAERYANTDTLVGVAAAAGEFEKLERYGSSVSPLSFEPYGRMGKESALALRSLALNGATFNNTGLPASRLYSRWRAELERTLVWEVADIVLLSLGHSSGIHSRRSTAARNPD